MKTTILDDIKAISKKFGGQREEELYEALINLKIIIEYEANYRSNRIKKQFQPVNDEETTQPDIDINNIHAYGLSGFIKETIESTIDCIFSSHKTDYEKTLLIIYACRLFGKEYHQGIIPDDLWHMFFSFAENKKFCISFTADMQYFIANKPKKDNDNQISEK